MQRQLQPISINTLCEIQAKNYLPASINSDTSPRFTVIGFVTAISPSTITVYDGSNSFTFDTEVELNFTPNQTVRLHLMITKSLIIRVIFSEIVQFAEQFLMHWVDAVRSGEGEKSKGGEGFTNFFDGIGNFEAM